MPLLRLGDATTDDWPSLGHDVADWVEDHLTHGPGDVRGDPLDLDDDEYDFLVDCYRLYPKGHDREGRRVVTRAVLSRAKGSRKSELAGAIEVAEAVGSVRFSHWEGNKPIGRRVRYPFIRALATEEGQAGNTYDNVRVMIEDAAERFPALFSSVDVGLTRTFLV